MADAAAFFDLDRTLLRGASGPILSGALRAEGLLGDKPLPGERLLFGIFDVIGETLPSMLLTRQGARAAKGWSVEAARRAGREAAPELLAAVEPFAREVIADHRAAGRRVVLATTTPHDLIRPFADLLGLDDVLATHYRVGPDERYDGTIDGEFVWSRGKQRSVVQWSRDNLVELADSYAYSDSVFDAPMLGSVGHPVAVNPDPRLLALASLRRWEIVWFNAPPGVPKPLGIEPSQIATTIARPGFLPWIDLDVDGLGHLPADGGAILAVNHRSYLDPLIVGLVAGRAGRPARFLAKKEVTDAPVVGQITRALGAIRVDRQAKGGGSGDDDPMRQAARALRAGELIAVFPQGTIPRGDAFFAPELEGRYGAARLAIETGVPIVPVGLWGTERAWPRNRKAPYVLNLADPPTVRVRLGAPYLPASTDLAEATEELMATILHLLPDEARRPRVPTEAELAATQPA